MLFILASPRCRLIKHLRFSWFCSCVTYKKRRNRGQHPMEGVWQNSSSTIGETKKNLNCWGYWNLYGNASRRKGPSHCLWTFHLAHPASIKIPHLTTFFKDERKKVNGSFLYFCAFSYFLLFYKKVVFTGKVIWPPSYTTMINKFFVLPPYLLAWYPFLVVMYNNESLSFYTGFMLLIISISL